MPCFYYHTTKGIPHYPKFSSGCIIQGEAHTPKASGTGECDVPYSIMLPSEFVEFLKPGQTRIHLYILSFLHKIFSSFYLANHFCTAFDTFCFVFLLAYACQILDTDYSFLPFNTNVISQRPTDLSTFVTQSHPLYNFELAP